MAEGRFYSPEIPTDADKFVLNETAARLLGPGSPVGKKFSFHGRTGTIIGVMKDYFGGPCIADPAQGHQIGERVFRQRPVRPGTTSAVLGFLTKPGKNSFLERPFRYDFLDESIENYYKRNSRIGKIFLVFAWLAILIAGLGLFGMAAYTAEQRTKEIGIRKALGARTSGLVFLLTGNSSNGFSGQYPRLAFGLRFGPLWLRGFAYKITLGPAVFLAASGFALAIALITVGYSWPGNPPRPIR